MNKDDLFLAIGQCDEELLHRCENYKGKKRGSFRKKMIGTVAAAAILGIVCVQLNEFGVFRQDRLNGIIQENDNNQETDWNDGNKDEGEQNVFPQEDNNYNEAEKEIDATMGGWGESETEDDYLPSKEWYGLNPEYEDCGYYSGVVLPLTLEQENDKILAVRKIDFDFQNFDSFENEGKVLITDTYTLENTSDEEQVVGVKYPFELSLNEIDSSKPRVTINGKERVTNLKAGRYYGINESGESRLLRIYNPEEYVSLLKDDKTLVQNLDDSILDEKVVVYEYHCAEEVKDGCYTAQIWVENQLKQSKYIKQNDNANVYRANMDSYYSEGNTEYYGFLTDEVKKTGKMPMLIFMEMSQKNTKSKAIQGSSIVKKRKWMICRWRWYDMNPHSERCLQNW